jgi:hypothetical protein
MNEEDLLAEDSLSRLLFMDIMKDSEVLLSPKDKIHYDDPEHKMWDDFILRCRKISKNNHGRLRRIVNRKVLNKGIVFDDGFKCLLKKKSKIF